ncbi:MAG: hypothetical protein CMJ74_06855 [Planctomycetaceae bacterium]|nr:hypothetical protein [Planctomycetaceae bacterium]|tara:strand:+ start:7659 stop:9137 length:1479 start_codon:yes stop_codon:yes gene_type:complete
MCDKHSQDERPISDVPTEERFLAETMAGNSGKDTAREQEGSEPVAREKIGRYQIEKVLGTGAMGAVYLARDETLDRRVAIKIPKFPEGAGDEVIQRFYREARSAAAITHPNICAIYDIGEEDGTYFIAMQYVEGHSLSDYVESHRQPQQQVAIVVRKIALAMHEAHLHKLVHRDLKPDNVMIDHRGEPVVMDFGLARRSDHEDVRITREGAISGSPAYMSPEQLEGKVADIDPRSDIYSLGVLFYEGLTGTLPFKGNGSIVALITEVISKKPIYPREIRRDLDPRICEICMRAMARHPTERYDSMQQFAAALDQYIQTWSALPTAPTEQEASPEIQLAADSSDTNVSVQTNTGEESTNIEDVREKCRRVREFLSNKDFGTAVNLLKQIADNRAAGLEKYADWAKAELPGVRSALAASQQEALSAVDVPVLRPLQEDVLWESTSVDLSESAELRPRDRGKSTVEHKKNLFLWIGGFLIVFLVVLGLVAIVLNS